MDKCGEVKGYNKRNINHIGLEHHNTKAKPAKSQSLNYKNLDLYHKAWKYVDLLINNLRGGVDER